MSVEQLVPRVGPAEIEEILAGLRAAPHRHATPFDPLRMEFSNAVSRAILESGRSRAFPELLALAFWLRRTAVSRLADRFAALESAGAARAPRGLVFHLPPTNVDTMFLYSLMTSFLVGNLNVVRVSQSRPTEQVTILCELLRGVLAEERFIEFADELAVVSYGHEPEPTAAASSQADVRMIWGGDETVALIRAVPAGPATHDLAFADRFSFALIRPAALCEADEASLGALAEQMFNDAYWFDQMGCASPRLIVWVGAADATEAASRRLFDALTRVISAKGYRLQTATAIAKLTFLYGAMIDRPVSHVRREGNELFVVALDDLERFDRTHPGGGLFFEARVAELSELVGFVRRKDQTVTAHGFSEAELVTFARSLAGRGVDRIVPFGEALNFDSVWDGYDLLAELTRSVAVVGPRDQAIGSGGRRPVASVTSSSAAASASSVRSSP